MLQSPKASIFSFSFFVLHSLLSNSGSNSPSKKEKTNFKEKLCGETGEPSDDMRRLALCICKSAGRSPGNCQIFFIDSQKLNAMSLGECRFGFTTGLINTGDERLIRGVAAHEIGHEVLGHADKRKMAIAAEQLTRTALSFIPGLGGLIASNAVLVTDMLALPAYSRSQETDADSKAVDILSKANDPDPAGTMAYSFRFLLKSSGATGGGLLDSHPNTRERLEAMVKLGNSQTTKAPLQTAPDSGPDAH